MEFAACHTCVVASKGLAKKWDRLYLPRQNRLGEDRARASRKFRGHLTETTTRGWDSDIMLEYGLVITSTQKHQCPSKGTPWALCTQPRSAVWGYFTPVLLIIHTSGPPYFHIYIGTTDWSRYQCHLSASGVGLWVLRSHR